MIRRFGGAPARQGGHSRGALPPGQRVYAIGDIHGRLDLLESLHGLIENDLASAPVARAEIVCLGDYVDRGLHSAGVLELLSGPAPAGLTRTLLKGNHEEILLRFLVEPGAALGWLRLGGIETMASYGVKALEMMVEMDLDDVAATFAARLPPHHKSMLESLPTSYVLGDYFFCHAGVRPGVALDRQAERDLIWIRDDFLDSRADHGKVVVHGHTPVLAPEILPNRINIDTGAFVSGCLTCLVLEGRDWRLLDTKCS